MLKANKYFSTFKHFHISLTISTFFYFDLVKKHMSSFWSDIVIPSSVLILGKH